MRKFFHFLVFLFLIFLFFQCFVIFLSKEHHIKYQIVKGKKNFLIEESYQIVEGKDRYHFVVNEDYVFDTFVPLHKISRLIVDILYYEDNNYTCIYPIFRTKKIKMDVLCKKDSLFSYHTIKGQNKKLDTFVSSIPHYDARLFEDNSTQKKNEFVTVYSDNVLENHFIALQNYKGIYHISKKDIIQKNKYYTHDIYEPKISISHDKYFVSALYKGEDTFDELVIIYLDKNVKKVMKVPDTSISSSFHLINNQIYLEDKSNDTIYLILPSKKTYRKVSSIPKTSSTFFQNKNYDKIEESSYYYYLYKTVGNKIKVSRVFKENNGIVMDLFTVDSIDKVKYYDEFIYFISDDTLYYYSDSTGLKKLLVYEELHFNKSLSYFVYKKH